MPKDDHPPSFPLYVDDLISDSAVDAMTNEEFGIYMRLLCKAWKQTPVGTVPNDDAILASWGKATKSEWQRCKAGVLRAFVERGNRLHQKRMMREWRKLLAYRKSKSEAGLRGAEGRWQKDGSRISTHGKRNANAMAKNGSSLSSSSSSSSSLDVDVDGARNPSFSENARANANRLAALVPSTKPDDRSLIAKVAVLWDDGTICQDAIEQAIESFKASDKRIDNPAGWFYRCMVNQCEQRGQNFEQLLVTTPIPVSLLIPGGAA